jgi:hypothetical protein
MEDFLNQQNQFFAKVGRIEDKREKKIVFE